MAKRIILVGAATALAFVLLLVTILAGPPAAKGRGGSINGGTRQISPAFDLEDEIEQGRADIPIREVKRGRMTFVEEDRLVHLDYDLLEPLPQGAFRVVNPVATVPIGPERVVQIRSDRGTFVRVGEELRSAELEGKVVLTLFALRVPDPVDLEQDAEVALKIFMDQADVDFDLGQIDSASAVHLTGPRIEFRGVGLNLTYNQLRNRINRLKIAEGRLLRFRRATNQGTGSLSVAPPVSGRGSSRTGRPTGRSRTDPAAGGRHFYRARLDDQVRIRAVNGEFEIDSDVLEVVFSVTAETFEQKEPKSVGKTTRNKPGSVGNRFMAARMHPLRPVALGLASLLITETAVENGRSLMAMSDEDVVVHWAGPLLIKPEPDPPGELSRSDDTLLIMSGGDQRVNIRTREQENVIADRVELVSGSVRIRAEGSATQPIVISSPQRGVLTGRLLTIDQTAGTGSVIGPGTFRAVGDSRMPPDFAVEFLDRLDLTFDQSEPSAGSDFDFRSDAALRTVSFRGGVRVTTAGDDPDEEYSLASHQLNIDLARHDDGGAGPARMFARGDVEVEHRGVHLWSQQLDVRVAAAQAGGDRRPGSVDPAGESVPGRGHLDRQDLAVQRVIATEKVRVQVDDPQVELFSDRLEARAESDQLELFGDDQTPARVVRDDGTLSGSHIILARRSQSVQVVGPGSADMPLDPDDRVAVLAVSWGDSMHYENLSGLAQFLGNVRLTTQTDNEKTRLACQDLRLVLEDIEEGGDVDSASSVESDGPTDGIDGRKRIRSATARKNVVFDAETLSPEAGNALASRFHLEGPVMEFDQATEQVQVVGAGKMLIEDYRPEPEGTVDKAVHISGRGQTLFAWDGKLTFDAAQNDMLIEDDVWMIHRPAGARGDERDDVRLYCEKLLADLEQTGGLGSWMSDESPQPKISLIRADRPVRILRQGHEVTADHLRYTAADDRVRLWSDDGRLVRVSETGQSPMSAESVDWYLDRDAFEATGIGGATIPLRRE